MEQPIQNPVQSAKESQDECCAMRAIEEKRGTVKFNYKTHTQYANGCFKKKLFTFVCYIFESIEVISDTVAFYPEHIRAEIILDSG